MSRRLSQRPVLIILTFVIAPSYLLNEGDGIGSVDLSHALDFDIVHPRISDALERRRRDINSNVYYEEENKLKIVELGDWVLELDVNHNLVLPSRFASEWVSEDLTVQQRPKKCDYNRGVVRGLSTTSTVAMAVCESEITGFVLIPGAVYFIQPFNASSNSHVMYKSTIFKSPFKSKRDTSIVDGSNESSQKWEFFNLTGDTIEIDEAENDTIEEPEENEGENSMKNVTKTRWWREQIDSEEIGYFFDTAWEANTACKPPLKVENNSVLIPQNCFLFMSLFFLDSYGRDGNTWSTPTRWLEIAIAADHTVIAFHGRERVEQYILALMNIVSK